MAKKSVYYAGNNFLSLYYKTKQKAERKHHDGGGNFGNFLGMKNGDMRGPHQPIK